MPADVDVNNADNGVDGAGNPLPWRWVYVRARTILGHCTKAIPFMHGTKPATVSLYDHIVGTSEQVASRYIASDGRVWDLHDYLRVQVELLISDTDPAKLETARAMAGVLRKWPEGFDGTPPSEVGK